MESQQPDSRETSQSVDVIHEPRVYLVGKTQMDQDVVDQFLDDEATTWQTDGDSGSELLSELAGRVCYMSFGERQGRRSNHDYLANIISMAHGSVLEHAVWNFLVTGVSRSFTHELIRHRAGWAYSQLSQRYVDEAEAAYVEPAIIAADPDLHAVWLHAIQTSHRAYQDLASGLSAKIARDFSDLALRDKRKKAREAARSVLPNATETKIVMSANGRALRHFVEYRGAADAEPEIRSVALRVLRIMQVEAPSLFRDYAVHELPDGSAAAGTEYKKV